MPAYNYAYLYWFSVRELLYFGGKENEEQNCKKIDSNDRGISNDVNAVCRMRFNEGA